MATNRGNRGNNNKQTKNLLLKVVILGDGGVGKSCLIRRFISDAFDSCSYHTIGVEFLDKDVAVNGETYKLQIWDTAGQERFKSLRTPFYRGSDICLLTFSIDDRRSFDNLVSWKKEFLFYADVREEVNFPFIVVGNKVDVDADKREVDRELVDQWCQVNGNIPYVETSAKDATNVSAAFHLAVESWLKMEEKMDKPFVGATVDLSRQSAQRACC